MKPTQTVKKKMWARIIVPKKISYAGFKAQVTLHFTKKDAEYFKFDRDVVVPVIINFPAPIKDKQ